MSSRVISSIYKQIRSKILLTGPITVADYMKMALTQQQSTLPDRSQRNITESGISGGYYMGKDVFGQHGDFITSPEISQLFGEMVGVWGVDTWKRIGGPSKFSIVELGPGRGTLAKDILRVFRQLNRASGTGTDISLHLVEISPFLAKIQAQTLCGQSAVSVNSNGRRAKEIDPMSGNAGGNSYYHHAVIPETNIPVYWYRDVSSLPEGFHFYIAHEFFDALPIHKLQRVENSWREVLVDLNPSNLINVSSALPESDAQKFRFVISRHETPAIKILQSYYQEILHDSRSHLEVSLEAIQIYEELCKRLELGGGLGLIIDYGHEGNKEDTFRGFFRHALHDPLESPGLADLTADVDFSLIRKVCEKKALICGPITQRQLLSGIGIDLRLKKLYDQCTNEEDKKGLVSGHKMLVEEMGERFKCLALFPKILEKFRPALQISAFDNLAIEGTVGKAPAPV